MLNRDASSIDAGVIQKPARPLDLFYVVRDRTYFHLGTACQFKGQFAGLNAVDESEALLIDGRQFKDFLCRGPSAI